MLPGASPYHGGQPGGPICSCFLAAFWAFLLWQHLQLWHGHWQLVPATAYGNGKNVNKWQCRQLGIPPASSTGATPARLVPSVANIYSQKKYFNHLDYKDLTPGATMGGAAGTHGLYMHKHALHLVISLCNESTNVTRYGFEIKQSTIGAMQALAAGAFGGDLGLMDPFGAGLVAGGIHNDAGYALAAVTAGGGGGGLATDVVALAGGVDAALASTGVAGLPVGFAVFVFGVVGICLGGGFANCVVALAGGEDAALAGNGVAGLPVGVAVFGFAGVVGMAVDLDVAGTGSVAGWWVVVLPFAWAVVLPLWWVSAPVVVSWPLLFSSILACLYCWLVLLGLVVLQSWGLGLKKLVLA